MAERPMLMIAPMVVATLNGTKTQTRRIVKPQPHYEHRFVGDGLVLHQKKGDKTTSIHTPLIAAHCPYGEPGDQLWVREAWSTHACFDHMPPRDCPKSIHYTADGPIATGKGRPSIHMPRWASRITLEITRVRVERLQDISEADSRAEGAAGHPDGPWHAYRSLWTLINGPDSWAANPWVWVVEFRRITP